SHAIGSFRDGPERSSGRPAPDWKPMADTRRKQQTRRFLSLTGGRLAQNRWMLAAGAVAVLAVGVAAGVPPPIAAAAILFLVVTAMLAPRRSQKERQA